MKTTHRHGLALAALAALGGALCSRSADAGGAHPSIVTAPLGVQRAPSAEVTAALNRHFKGLLMKDPGVLTPTPSAWEAAVTKENRQDCDVSDDCLRSLAVVADTVYAIYASVELDLTRTHVTAVGRIVRRDGTLVEVNGQHSFTVELATGREPFETAAKSALAKLLAKMQLARLSPTVPVAATAEVTPAPPPPAPAPAPATPPPSTPSAPSAAEPKPAPAQSVVHAAVPGRSALPSRLLIVGGGVLLVAGAVTAIVGELQEGGLHPVNGNLPAAEVGAYRAAVLLRPVGLAVGAVGFAAAAVGVLLGWTDDSSGMRASVAPLATGFVLGLGGRW